jgi:hypothetical protein
MRQRKKISWRILHIMVPSYAFSEASIETFFSRFDYVRDHDNRDELIKTCHGSLCYCITLWSLPMPPKQIISPPNENWTRSIWGKYTEEYSGVCILIIVAVITFSLPIPNDYFCVTDIVMPRDQRWWWADDCWGHQEGNDENWFHGSPIEALVLQMTTQTTKITI